MNRKFTTLFLSLLLAAVPLTHAAADTKAARYYEDALSRYDKKDVAGAIIQLKNALQIDKNMLPVHVLLGKSLLATSEVIGAEVAFNEALRLGVNRAEVVIPLARSVIAQGRLQELLDKPVFSPAGLPTSTQAQLLLLRASAAADIGGAPAAMRSIEEARAIEPGSPDSWLAEVPLRIRAGQYREAEAAADRALLLSPTSAEAMYLRGSIAHVQGNAASALATYAKALKINPAHTEALVSRAGLLMDRKRVAEASADIAELLKSSPNDPRGFYLSALISEQAGNTAASKAALNKITALLDPVPIDALRYRPQALMLGGLAHYGLNQLEKAKAYLEAVQRAQPGSSVAKLLAQIYFLDKNTDRAITALEPYLKAHPNDSQALLLLSSAQMAQGRYGRASQLMQDALRGDDRPEYRTMLGMSLVGSGKFADAVSALEAAFQKDPRQLQAGVALANLYIKGGQAARSVKIAESLAKLNPSNPGVQNLLGQARAGTGNRAGARLAYEAAIKLDASFAQPQVNLAELDIDDRAYDAAANRLTPLLAGDAKNLEAMDALGRLHERRGQLPEAQRWLTKAAETSGPDNVQPALKLVEFHLRNNQPSAAKESTKFLTSKAPDALPALVMLARVNLANSELVPARSNLSRAATLANQNPTLLLKIAMLQSDAGHFPGAAYSLGKALAERPDFLAAQALMAEVEMRLGELDKADQRIRQIIASHPKEGVGYGLQGDLAKARGQRSGAIDAYRRAHQLEQSTASLLRLYVALAPSEPAAALQLADQWVKTRPQDTAVRRALAAAHARAGNLKAARSAYEALLKVTPEDADSLNNLANVLLLTQEPGALKVAEQAMALSPTAPHILGTVGWAAFKAGQTDRALQLLRDALLRDPANRDTRYFLGAVLANTGRSNEARAELEAALGGDQLFANAKDAKQLLGTLK
jgi:cellulose synthase operon protein C